MFEYRVHPLSSVPLASSRGTTPATPHKTSQSAKSFGHFNAGTRYTLNNDMINDILRNVEASPHEGTVEEEYKRYVSATSSPHETDILHFWEVSTLLTVEVSRMNTAHWDCI